MDSRRNVTRRAAIAAAGGLVLACVGGCAGGASSDSAGASATATAAATTGLAAGETAPSRDPEGEKQARTAAAAYLEGKYGWEPPEYEVEEVAPVMRRWESTGMATSHELDQPVYLGCYDALVRGPGERVFMARFDPSVSGRGEDSYQLDRIEESIEELGRIALDEFGDFGYQGNSVRSSEGGLGSGGESEVTDGLVGTADERLATGLVAVRVEGDELPAGVHGSLNVVGIPLRDESDYDKRDEMKARVAEAFGPASGLEARIDVHLMFDVDYGNETLAKSREAHHEETWIADEQRWHY